MWLTRDGTCVGVVGKVPYGAHHCDSSYNARNKAYGIYKRIKPKASTVDRAPHGSFSWNLVPGGASNASLRVLALPFVAAHCNYDGRQHQTTAVV